MNTSPTRARRPRSRRRSHRAAVALAGVCTAVVASIIGFGVANAAPPSPTDATSVAVPVGGIGFVAPTGVVPVPSGPGSSAEQQVFALLNQQRAEHRLPALTWSAELAQAALTHNRAMSAADTLSHQLPGEADLGTRITNAGYRWGTALENIGWISRTDDSAAVKIQGLFYDEVPPNDGHRLNILATSSKQVGISVFIDARGKLWVTEDFASPR